MNEIFLLLLFKLDIFYVHISGLIFNLNLLNNQKPHQVEGNPWAIFNNFWRLWPTGNGVQLLIIIIPQTTTITIMMKPKHHQLLLHVQHQLVPKIIIKVIPKWNGAKVLVLNAIKVIQPITKLKSLKKLLQQQQHHHYQQHWNIKNIIINLW